MFKDMKPGLQMLILDKSASPMKCHTGKVIKVSPPRVEMQKTDGPIPFPSFQMQDRVVDLTVEYDGKTQTFVVPENSNVAYGDSVTIACNEEPIIGEVKSRMRESADIVDSYEYHKANIEECRSILASLSPQYADTQNQDRRLSALEGDIGEIKDMLRSFMERRNENVGFDESGTRMDARRLPARRQQQAPEGV